MRQWTLKLVAVRLLAPHTTWPVISAGVSAAVSTLMVALLRALSASRRVLRRSLAEGAAVAGQHRGAGGQYAGQTKQVSVAGLGIASTYCQDLCYHLAAKKPPPARPNCTKITILLLRRPGRVAQQRLTCGCTETRVSHNHAAY